MSYEQLLSDRCDVYHIKIKNKDNNFGLPQDKKYYYDTDPDIENQKCYFSSNPYVSISQGEPNRTVYERLKIHFPINTDVRLNDKVIKDGVEFKLQTPRKIRKHHIEVVAVRNEPL